MKAMRTKLDIFPEKEEPCLGILSNTGYCFSQSGVGGWRIIVDSGCGLRIWLSPRRGNILWEGETSRSFGSRVELAWWVRKERIPKGKSSIPTRHCWALKQFWGLQARLGRQSKSWRRLDLLEITQLVSDEIQIWNQIFSLQAHHGNFTLAKAHIYRSPELAWNLQRQCK